MKKESEELKLKVPVIDATYFRAEVSLPNVEDVSN
jgi:hypothetical protein